MHKYNVPLQNCFMSLEDMKTRFFEIASAYAKDTGCTFVIAIDGIDHAARAGIISETFLATLPRPEYIPDNIKLFISGQTIGRFEYYYGSRTDMGNRVYVNQPIIQRWVITKDSFNKIQDMLAFDLKQVADAMIFEIDQG